MQCQGLFCFLDLVVCFINEAGLGYAAADDSLGYLSEELFSRLVGGILLFRLALADRRDDMMRCSRKFFLLMLLLVLGGCATIPEGPRVLVLPGPGKSFEEFQVEDAFCRQWATQQTGLTAQAASNQDTITGAALGTLIGAGLGAAIGAAAGDPGMGAAIGAGSGLLGGTLLGADAGQAAGEGIQNRYDIAYQQCMYAKGNQVEGMVQSDEVSD
jgi:hypothetical protein